MKPTPEVFRDVILPQAEEYAIQYLSDPFMWAGKYVYKGKQLFYDTESKGKMFNRGDSHLIDNWEVSLSLVDGRMLKIGVDNPKYVGEYKLIELLYNGTERYESEDYMKFYYRFDGKWHSKKSRRGIRPSITLQFRQLLKDSIKYGVQRALREWRSK